MVWMSAEQCLFEGGYWEIILQWPHFYSYFFSPLFLPDAETLLLDREIGGVHSFGSFRRKAHGTYHILMVIARYLDTEEALEFFSFLGK